jgi:protein O-mannosyl-transferase
MNRVARLIGGGLIVLAALAAYSDSLSNPFVSNDIDGIANNPTIRRFWPIWGALAPPRGGLPVSGRPLVNFTFALNYAAGGLKVWGYHAVNLALHILAGLILFGIIRRTMELAALQATGRNQAVDSISSTTVAGAIGLLWTVHPLQTAAVTYVSQRAELLMGLMYLLTLYCVIRGGTVADGPLIRNGPRRRVIFWYAFAIVACLAGMAAKEVMVSAPLLVLLYDRTFLAGTFREAWRRRRGLYAGLACTWLLLVYLVVGVGDRGGTAGFSSSVSWKIYALLQSHAILHYLRLAVWPHPLVFYYGAAVWAPWVALISETVLVVVLIGAVGCSLYFCTGQGVGSRSLGFVGAWFFAILAPSSSIMPISTEIMAEHRMYLPLAAVLVVAVLALCALLGRCSDFLSVAARRGTFGGVVIAATLGLSAMTARRNDDYRSGLALWTDTVAKTPDNPSARLNLGDALVEAGRPVEAVIQFEDAVQLRPDVAQVRYDLGNALARSGRLREAISQFEEAIRLKPDYTAAHANLAIACAATGSRTEAIAQFEETLRLEPDLADTHYDLANLLVAEGQVDEAIKHFEIALRLKPDFVATHVNLGNALIRRGRIEEAIEQYESALRIEPHNGKIHRNLGQIFRAIGRNQEAQEQFNLAQ